MAEKVTESLPASQNESAQLEGCVDLDSHVFKTPQKEISGPQDIPKWEKSQAYHDITGFILTVNDAIKGKKMTENYHVSELCEKLTVMLDEFSAWIDEIPPVEQPQRFGNKAFRDWFNKLKENSDSCLKKVLDEKLFPALPELSHYLVESVGNSTRIDYGTGHEMSFVAFLCCLFKLGALRSDDFIASCLKVFFKYLIVVRKLQTVYRMEPAGSHGVWSLDDYHFLPFLFGSSQLINHPRIFPKSFVKPEIYEHFSKDYMFLSCIKYINEVKTGPFAEHSNQLWNISGVPNWAKVNSGLIKMYKAEVLSKHPIMQHFLFGSLLSIDPLP
ncbi:serine/threonine-protein phosphatase 2A activator-like isoform X2 [Gigantopelta aegis]|uniref:serine/threonine-protein phosphatase 2A activator-like isoform X2 n=1 Tax=Gigantopelta aegis TaxID=1735272 RepID=UPI001B88E1F5|nr:serine/threonine-protein phosphatase 2A activator-like isoform X2 [Gigantopelta aegis]